MGARRGGDRRDQILRAALAVVRSRGFSSTRIVDVTTEAGISLGLVHHYFEDREALLAEAFALAVDEDLAATTKHVADQPGPVAALSRMLSLYTSPRDDDDYRLWVDAWAEGRQNAVLRGRSTELMRSWHNAFRSVIVDGVESGDFVTEDPHGAVWRIIAAIDGTAMLCVIHELVPRSGIREAARRVAVHELGLPPDALLLEPAD
ncbi:MAG: TetR/AcrR family transcriptional regulator [Phycicoccus sp.]